MRKSGSVLTAALAVKTDQPGSLELHSATVPIADLYPGGTGSAQFSIVNPNPFAVRLQSISFAEVTSSDPSGCPANWLTRHNLFLPADVVVGANEQGKNYLIPDAFTLSRDAPDQCQGVVFVVATRVHATALSSETEPQALAQTGAELLLLISGAFLLLLLGTLVMVTTRARCE